MYIVGLLISVLVLFTVIRLAVRYALEEHYKTVRWYEHTGEWVGQRAPRAFEQVGSATVGESPRG